MMWGSNGRLKSIAELLEIILSTVLKIIKKLKEKLPLNFYGEQKKIGGKGIIVEIDESKFVSVKYFKRHKVDGVWVFGIV